VTCNVLILAAGEARDRNDRREAPFCLSEFEGQLLIERILQSTSKINAAKYFCAILDEDIRGFFLDDVVKQIVSGVTIVRVPEITGGSACTALLAAVRMNGELPLLIISANELIKLDLNEVLDDFKNRALDAGTIVFRGLHPRYSFVRLNEAGLVEETAQHRPISYEATTGTFWFTRTNYFIEAAKKLMRKDSSVGGKFYLAPVLNELILKQARIGVFHIPQEMYVPLKNSNQAKNYVDGR
jgi:hypothetical protein